MTTIKVRKNGPYLVIGGGVQITDHEGKPIQPDKSENFVLCRCGHSRSKPFCDGSHRGAEFDDGS